MEGLRNVCIDLSNFGLNFFGPRMGLIESQSVQGGKDLALVPPGHPKAVFEAVFEVDFGGNFVGKLFLFSEFCSSVTLFVSFVFWFLDFEPIWMSPSESGSESESESKPESESGLREPGESRPGEVKRKSGLDESGCSTRFGFPTECG